MSDRSPPDPAHVRLIETLAGGLRPVRRLHAPWLRATFWAAACAAAALLLLAVDHHARSGAADWPERLSLPLAILTALCAALAALSLAIPGRSPRWALLPLPPLLAWLALNGLGCWTETDTGDSPTPIACFRFIVAAALPLAAILFLLLRRAYCVRPRRTATLAGLAAAAAAAATLEAYHAHPMPPSDLAAHAAAIAAVALTCRLALPRLLR